MQDMKVSCACDYNNKATSLANAPTKKALFLALSDRPIIIDHGLKSFQLDRKNGKICYMLAARSLTIDCGNDDSDSDSDGEIGIKKEWIPMHDSRFPEVAKICQVYSLEIRGMINTLVLSSNTQYAAYLVFKMIDAYGFDYEPVELSVGVEGGHSSNKSVCLDPNVKHIKPHDTKVIGHTHSARCKCYRGSWSPHSRVLGLQCPSVRSDGWLEIEMGEFFNSNLEDKQVQMSVIEKSSKWVVKGNFFLEGIEVRLKE